MKMRGLEMEFREQIECLRRYASGPFTIYFYLALLMQVV